jgi:NADPH:quinone reductase
VRAAMIRALGPPESLVIEERPAPTPGPGEITARVDAAGVNFADVLMIAGKYQVKPALPYVPGFEFCGTVSAVGAGVTRWRAGDRVMGAPLGGGCFAEEVAVCASHVFRAPPSLSDDLAAQFVVAYGTAAFALQRARLTSAETVLVSGAGGGVGVAAVDIATRLGARVIAAASSPEKLHAARAHGAQALVDYQAEAIRESVKELTAGRGADVVLDTVGGPFFDEALRSMARRGRLLVVGFASGSLPRVPAEYLLLKNLTVIGVGFGGILQAEPQSVEAVLEDLLSMHAQRPFAAEIAGRFALEQTSVALERLARRAVVGKQLIIPHLARPQARAALQPPTPQSGA